MVTGFEEFQGTEVFGVQDLGRWLSGSKRVRFLGLLSSYTQRLEFHSSSRFLGFRAGCKPGSSQDRNHVIIGMEEILLRAEMPPMNTCYLPKRPLTGLRPYRDTDQV